MEESAVPEPPISAFDKVQARRPDTATTRWWKPIALLLAGATGLWLAFTWIRGDGPPPESSLLVQLSTASDTFRPATPVRDGDEASAWVMDQYGWPIVIPDLPDLELVGAGETSVSDASSSESSETTWVTPTFRYMGTGAESLTLYAYDYAQLDRASSWLMLPQGVFARLAEETPFDTRRIDTNGDYAITWRRRATVFTAITESESVVERLTEALSVPVRL